MKRPENILSKPWKITEYINWLESQLAEAKEKKIVMEYFGNCSEGNIGFYLEKHRELIKTLTQGLEEENLCLGCAGLLELERRENTKLKEALKESKDILSNVYYWETCPEDYKKKIEALTQDKGEENELS